MPYNIIEVDGVKNLPNERFPVDVELHPEPHAINDLTIHTGILDDGQIPDLIMRDAEHQLDPHTMIIDGRDVSVDGSKLDTIEVGAEVNNLTDMQANSLTSGLHSGWHHHDDFYYRETELQTPGESAVHWLNLTNVPDFSTNHNHDDRYYTESEINTILNNYYTSAELNAGQLNNIYYTENEIDSLIGDYYTKTELDGGQLDNRYFTESEITTNYYDKPEIDALLTAAAFGIKGSVNTFTDLPGSEDTGSIYIVKQTVGSDEEGFYRWNGSSWDFLANNTGTTNHNDLPDLNTGSYYHLTQTEYTDLTDGGDTTLHHHDNRYFTESEITTNYYSKTDLDSGQLDNRYYTKTFINGTYYTAAQLNNGQLDNRYYTETEINGLLSGYSPVGHIHDDRYYTETEIDTFMTLYYSAAELDGGALDGRYYTENEINVILDNYYTKAELDGGQLNTLYYTKAQLDSVIDGSSGADIINITPLPGGTANTVQGALEELASGLGGSSGTLDEAYDFGSSGAGREIIVDSAPVKLNSTSGTDAPLELTNRTSVPSTNLAAGQIAIIDGIFYVYDETRNKWLSPSKLLTYGRNNNADGTNLKPADVSDFDSGYRMPRKGTIISVTLDSNSPFVNGKQIFLIRNSTLENSFFTNSLGNINDTSVDIDFNANDELGWYVSSSGSPLQDAVLVMEVCWRA